MYCMPPPINVNTARAINKRNRNLRAAYDKGSSSAPIKTANTDMINWVVVMRIKQKREKHKCSLVRERAGSYSTRMGGHFNRPRQAARGLTPKPGLRPCS